MNSKNPPLTLPYQGGGTVVSSPDKGRSGGVWGNLKELRNQRELHLTVTVKSPGQKIFDGTAEAVTSKNERGTFDILPYHANFISLIKEKITIHQKDKKPLQISVESGIVQVYENTVKILVGVESTV